MTILSVVHIVPAEYVQAVNEAAEKLDCGYGNISIPLFKEGEVPTHYGCHSFWYEEDYAKFVDILSKSDAMFTNLFTRTSRDIKDPRTTWELALKDLGLFEQIYNDLA